MRTYLVTLAFLFISYHLGYSDDEHIKELWRKDIHDYIQLEVTPKSKVEFENHILIKDVNDDGKPEVIVATQRFPEPSPATEKILALNGVDGNPIWEQKFDCGMLGVGEVNLDNTPAIVALGDSVEGYFLSALDGKVLKTTKVEEVDYFAPLAVSSAGDLAITTRRGGSLLMINPPTSETKWEAKSETDKPTSEKKGFLSPVLADMNDDRIEDVALVDCWALKLVVLDGKDGKQIWKADLARKEYKGDTKRKLSGDLVFTSPCVGDFDNNGQKEVVVGTMGGAISIFSGTDGTRIFQSQVSQENPMKKEVPALFKLFIPKLPRGGIIFQLASADLNNDSFLDIISTCIDQKIYALDGKSRKQLWEIKTDTYKQNQVFSQPAIADMDGDDSLDIVVFNSSGNLYCIKGQNGSLLWKHHVTEAEDLQVTSLFLADLNGDGFVEVIIPETKKGEVVVYTTDAMCHPGEITWGMPLRNPQNNPVAERR